MFFFKPLTTHRAVRIFRKKNIYVKKNPRKKGVYLLTVFIFCLPFCVITAIFSFLFLFFQLFAKKEWHLHCLHQHYQSVGNHEYSLVFFYLKSSLGSLIGMCTNSRFFWQVLSSVFALGSASRTLFSEILIWCYQWIKDYLYLFHVTYTPTANSVLRSVYRGKEQVSRYEEEEGDMYREKEQVPRYEEEEEMNREKEQVPRYEEEDYIWIRGKE